MAKIIKIFIVHTLIIFILFCLEEIVSTDSIFPHYRIELFKSNIVFFLFIAIIVLPIIEEFIFRLPLKKSKFSIASLIIGIPFIILVAGKKYLGIGISMTICNLFMLYFYLFTKKRQAPLGLIVIYILIFTSSHWGIYEDEIISNPALYKIFFVLSPYVVGGCVLSYLRVYNNFRTALLYHMATNFIFMMPILILNI